MAIDFPIARNCHTLLNELKERSFGPANGERENTVSGRPDSLCTLVEILQTQAENDGFRLITVNAEPKRIILGCSRQGKPPAPKENDDEEKGDEEEQVKKISRGSQRCGCKMRVNINFNSKNNSWRITSFESQHNHEISAFAVDHDVDPEFKIDDSVIFNAIQKYSEDHPRPNSPGEVAHTLALLSRTEDVPQISMDAGSNVNGSMSPVSPDTKKRKLLPIDTVISPRITPHLAEYPKSANNAQGGRPNRVFLIRRRESGGIIQQNGVNMVPRSPNHVQYFKQDFSSPLNSQSPSIPQQPSGENLKNLATTAIELDRYAMLHSAFKKLIAIACKNREWTEEVLGKTGMMIASFEGRSPNPAESERKLSDQSNPEDYKRRISSIGESK
jgi:hypothetical protein